MNCRTAEITNKTRPETLAFLREFNNTSARLRVPLAGSLDLTHRCNLNCVHCYLGDSSVRNSSVRPEMESSRIFSVIDEITEAGCLYFLITGGEPLVRPDFPDIYQRAKMNGLLVTVFTNATIISDSIAELFTELPPRLVEISLYGATAETYEKITRVPGSYEKCLEGIRRLIAKGIRVRLKTILMTINRHEFIAIEKIANAFGVEFRFDAAIFPCSNGDKSPVGLRVRPDEAVEKEFNDSARARQWEEFFNKSGRFQLSERLYDCGAGITGFHIDPYGNLKPCLMSGRVASNLLSSSFAEGWCAVSDVMESNKAGRLPGCRECEKRHLCGYCPAFFELENGAEDICSEYLCAIGSQRLSRIRNTVLPEVGYAG